MSLLSPFTEFACYLKLNKTEVGVSWDFKITSVTRVFYGIRFQMLMQELTDAYRISRCRHFHSRLFLVLDSTASVKKTRSEHHRRRKLTLSAGIALQRASRVLYQLLPPRHAFKHVHQNVILHQPHQQAVLLLREVALQHHMAVPAHPDCVRVGPVGGGGGGISSLFHKIL